MSGPLLVIGYGNELRRDDGAGPAVARAAGSLPGVRAAEAHQLTPELCALFAGAAGVVFVDAAVGARGVEVRRVRAGPPPAWGHAGDPGWLLALSAAVHGSAPPAWLVTVPAEDLGFGFGLSAAARAGVGEAVARVGAIRAGLA